MDETNEKQWKPMNTDKKKTRIKMVETIENYWILLKTVKRLKTDKRLKTFEN